MTASATHSCWLGVHPSAECSAAEIFASTPEDVWGLEGALPAWPLLGCSTCTNSLDGSDCAYAAGEASSCAGTSACLNSPAGDASVAGVASAAVAADAAGVASAAGAATATGDAAAGAASVDAAAALEVEGASAVRSGDGGGVSSATLLVTVSIYNTHAKTESR